MTLATGDEDGHTLLLGGSRPGALSLPLLPLCCCDGCLVNVNDFNFTIELAEGEEGLGLVGRETLDCWTTSVCVLITVGLLLLPGALLLEEKGKEEFPASSVWETGVSVGPKSQLVHLPSVKEENISSASLKISYKGNEWMFEAAYKSCCPISAYIINVKDVLIFIL